jgi:glutamyl-tRNA reductase
VLSGAPPSVAGAAVRRAYDIPGGIKDKKAVVIGNGKMGRLCAEQLRDAGCTVTVTLRSYRHGQTVVPRGCGTVPYDERMSAIDGCDLLVSATTSPHFTISKSMLESVAKKPKMIIDLAVPRDIEPETAGIPGIIFIDMDTLTTPGDVQNHNEAGFAETEIIIDKHFNEFYRWLRRRNGDA